MEIHLLNKKVWQFKFSEFTSLGYLLAISSAALAALIHVLAKPLLESNNGESLGVSPLTMVAVIFLINGLFFTPLTRKQSPLSKIGKKNFLILFLIGIAEASALIIYFFGLKDSTAINASVLSNGEIIFSLVIAITIFKERLTRKEIMPFSMIIIGTILLPIGFDLYNNSMSFSNLVYGNMLILLSGLFYALDINICKYISARLDSKRILQITSFASGIFTLGIMIFFNIPLAFDISKIPSIAVIGIAGTGISTLFFIISLRLIGSVRTVLLYSTGAIFGILFSSIFLTEIIQPLNIFSIILALIGIYILRNRLREKDEEKQSCQSNKKRIGVQNLDTNKKMEERKT